MAWYRPGRDPNHPGDPPPKWAPLGKATRLALLVTVIAGVVIALVIIATRSAGATDGTDGTTTDPRASSPPWIGGRVEMSDHGFAVTLPDGWFAIDLTGDVEQQILTLFSDEVFATPPEEADAAREALIAEWQAMGEAGVQLLASVGSAAVDDALCVISVEEVHEPVDIDALAMRLSESLATSEYLTLAGPPEDAALPIGPARLFRYRESGTAEGRSGTLENTSYLGLAEGHLFIVRCGGNERPSDDWSRFVESIEVLPSGE